MSETNHKIKNAKEKNIKGYYQAQSQIIQFVYKQDIKTVPLPKVPVALPLKFLADKSVWVEQWPLTSEKLQALGQQVWEYLNGPHIDEITTP